MNRTIFRLGTFALSLCASAFIFACRNFILTTYCARFENKVLLSLVFTSALGLGIYLGAYLCDRYARHSFPSAMVSMAGASMLVFYHALRALVGTGNISGDPYHSLPIYFSFSSLPLLLAAASVPALACLENPSNENKTNPLAKCSALASLGAVAGYLFAKYIFPNSTGAFESLFFIVCSMVLLAISLAGANPPAKTDCESCGEKPGLDTIDEQSRDKMPRNAPMPRYWHALALAVLSGTIFYASVFISGQIIHLAYGNALLISSIGTLVILVSLALGFFYSATERGKSSTSTHAFAAIAVAAAWFAATSIFHRPILVALGSLHFELSLLLASVVFLSAPSLLVSAAIGSSLGPLGSCTVKTTARSWSLLAAAILTGAIIAPITPPGTNAILSVARSLSSGNDSLIETLQSPYGEIRIVEKYGARFMIAGGNICAEVDAESLEVLSPYVDVLELASGFSSKPGRMLILGLGGGLVARRFSSKGWEISAVEVDEANIEAATKFFGLERDRIEFLDLHAWKSIRKASEPWDLIILDTGASRDIAYCLMTEMAFASMRRQLAPEGVLAINTISLGWNDPLVEAIACTLAKVFRKTSILPIAEPPNEIGNIIILASDRDLELPQEPPSPDDRFSHEYNMAHAWDNRFTIECDERSRTIQDFDSIELLYDRASRAMAKSTRDYFGISALIP